MYMPPSVPPVLNTAASHPPPPLSLSLSLSLSVKIRLLLQSNLMGRYIRYHILHKQIKKKTTSLRPDLPPMVSPPFPLLLSLFYLFALHAHMRPIAVTKGALHFASLFVHRRPFAAFCNVDLLPLRCLFWRLQPTQPCVNWIHNTAVHSRRMRLSPIMMFHIAFCFSYSLRVI